MAKVAYHLSEAKTSLQLLIRLRLRNRIDEQWGYTGLEIENRMRAPVFDRVRITLQFDTSHFTLKGEGR